MKIILCSTSLCCRINNISISFLSVWRCYRVSHTNVYLVQETEDYDGVNLEGLQEEFEGNKDAARALMRVKQKLDGYEGGEMRSIHGQVSFLTFLIKKLSKLFLVSQVNWSVFVQKLTSSVGTATNTRCDRHRSFIPYVPWLGSLDVSNNSSLLLHMLQFLF